MDAVRDEWYRLHGIMCEGHVIFSDMSAAVVQQQSADMIPEQLLAFHLSSTADLVGGDSGI